MMNFVAHSQFPHIEAQIDELHSRAIVRCGRCGTVSSASFADMLIHGESKRFVAEHKDCLKNNMSNVTITEERMQFAREEAAQVWCRPETEHKEMDPELAEAFARVLVKHMYTPHLGCATTGELVEEIKARSDLDYRTIDQH